MIEGGQIINGGTSTGGPLIIKDSLILSDNSSTGGLIIIEGGQIV